MYKFEFYDTPDDGDYDGYGANWMAQTFTPLLAHMISKVKLKLFRVGNPGTITVSIKNTTLGKPSGADLCSGTIEGLDVTEDPAGEWYEITLGAGYTFAAGQQYAIVVRAPAGDAGKKISWRADVNESTYPRGTFCSSSNSGVSWGTVSGSDCMFEEWGAGETSPTTVCWGNLFKSAIDAQKIEDAIIAWILAHNDDPDAHAEAGQSLNSHKAYEIIDHVASSIIEDKVRNGEISLMKTSFLEHQVYTVFESLDGWQKSPSGISFSIWGACLQTSSTINTERYLSAEPFGDDSCLDWDKDMFFQTGVKFIDNSNQLAYYLAGSCSFDGTDNSFGFKIVNGTLYAIHIKGDGMSQTEYTTEIPDIVVTDWHVYRVFYDHLKEKFYFYVDGELVATHDSNIPEYNNPILFTYYVKNSSAANKGLFTKYLLFSRAQ